MTKTTREEKQDEAFNLVESFLYKWRSMWINDFKGSTEEKQEALKTLYQYLPTDSQKMKIIKQII